ncbi:hypothetical protein, partial [Arsukibacterium sp.]|uniref:hypothetical protein n=1 Tax=Arsukibacterium sp. TaxID=1977258 RepID=UPI002FD8916D
LGVRIPLPLPLICIMNISASQSQLLRQLNIKPLHARDDFFPNHTTNNNDLASSPTELLLPQQSVLSDDINCLLATSSVSGWLLDPAANECRLSADNELLITPILEKLKQTELKRQLWLLLQPLLIEYVD